MTGFEAQRKKIKDELDDFFSIFVYEEDVDSKSQSIRETYLAEVSKCDLYIGIFETAYAKGTIEEFEEARDLKKDCHIYEKELLPTEKRDKKLEEFLKEINKLDSGFTPCRYTDIDDLIEKIKKSLVSWIKSRDSTALDTPKTPKLDINKKYFCNRFAQAAAFREFDKKEKFNFFIIDGARKQSHISLVKRFSIDKTASDHTKRPISIQDIGNINRLKIHIQTELFRKFNISPIPNDLSIRSLVRSIKSHEYKKVFVIFRIEEDLLSNQNITETILWFARQYCDKDSLPSESPDFYFFLLIRYNETGTSQKKSIRKRLEKFKGYIKLDELHNVGYDDILGWIEDQGITDIETSQEDIVSAYFEQGYQPMEIAEIQMAKLISDYNNEDQTLLDLINKN